ncbi:MAG: hypothetical protein ABA06_00985 [Parcubacteria bacterium C7867-001]|nr:MAG: hypothetical protein ABA06_00985 [Parcubacteria bacterium C7867-001]
MPQTKTGWRIDYPWNYLGARMYLVNPENPTEGLTLKKKLLQRNDHFPLHAGFCKKCEGSYKIDTSWKIDCKEDSPHGHVIFSSDDGTAVIRVPIYSKAFLKEVVTRLNFVESEKAAIEVVLSTSITELPDELQPNEQVLLDDTERFAGLLRYSWLSL